MSIVTGGVIQAVGTMSILYRYNRAGYPEVGNGDTLALGGFKLNAEFLSTTQTVPNSVIIPLLGGGSVQLTNDNRSGTITFTVTRTAQTAESNGVLETTYLDDDGNIQTGPAPDVTIGVDLVSLALNQIALQGMDSSGCTLSCATSFNGVAFIINFEGCTVVSCEPLRLAGNDVPTYTVVFNYHRWHQIT